MNDSIFLFFHSFANQSAVLDWIIVFFAHYFPFVVIILAGLFILLHHEVLKAESPWHIFLEKKKEVTSVFVAGMLAWIGAQVLKLLFAAVRPVGELANVSPLIEKSDFSFPSGHATFFVALATAIFLVHKRAGYVFIVCALLISVARVMAGVHYPVDILGGFALGALIAYLARKI